MKTKTLLAAATLLVLLLAASRARATVINFNDSFNYWPGYGNTVSGQNSKDVIGTPNLLGGFFEITDHILTGISLDYTVPETSLWSSLAPGDWFLDLNCDNIWDIVIRSCKTQNGGGWNVYKVAIDYYNKNAYEMSTGPRGSTWRKNHPVYAKGNYLKSSNKLGQAEFSGLVKNPKKNKTYTAYWDLDNLSIDLSDCTEFRYGFAMSCANDVLFGCIQIPYESAPEPGTLLLLGVGLAGVACYARKRRTI